MASSRPANAPTADTHFSLRTFGETTLHGSNGDGRSTKVPVVGKQFALLAYLACARGRAASRADLISLFAPEDGTSESSRADEKARDAVRGLIHELREKLGAAALGSARSDPIQLVVPLTCDRDELLAASERRDADTVVGMYGGDFLPRLESVARSGFGLWVERERAHLRGRFVQAARHAVTRDLDKPHDLDAIRRARDTSRRLLDLDGFSQEAWQLLLRSLILCGEHAEARQEADRLEHFLTMEGLPLEPATQVVLATAKAGRPRKIVTTAESGAAFHKQRHDSLVGRDSENATILSAWERARIGSLVHLHIVAPAGFGKTALLADIRQRLRAQSRAGTRAVEVRATHGSSEIAFAFVADLALVLAKRPGGIGVSEGAAAALVALSPALSDVYRAAPRHAGASSEDPRDSIERAIQELIAAVALEGPLALFLDDVHWSDQESLDVLAVSLQGCTNLSVLVVSAGRGPWEALRGPAEARQLHLHPFDIDSVTELLSCTAALPDEPWAERLPRALVNATAGSPLLIAETLQYLREEAVLVTARDAWVVRDSTQLFAALHEGGASRRRVEHLTSPERRLLLLLSVSGGPLTSGELRTAAAQSFADFNASLTTLERRGLVTRFGGEWTIAHDEYTTALRTATDDLSMRAAANAVGMAIVATAGDDLRKLRRAGPLVARGGKSAEIASVLERFVRLSRVRGDRRPNRVLAREFLGDAANDESAVERCVAQLPLRVRAGLVSRRRIVVASAAGLSVLFASVALAVWLAARHDPVRPDAVLVAQRLSVDHATIELFPVPLDASHWAGISVIDVPVARRPQWRIAALHSNGSREGRPDGRGFTGGVVVPDSGAIDIFDMSLGGDTTRLTFSRGDDYQPAWAPDNSRLVFVTARWSQHGQYDLAILDTLTHDVRQLTRGDDTDSEPAWSPDGSRIAFIRQSAEGGQRALCVIDTDGDNLRCLPPEPNTFIALAGWSDAHRVLVHRTFGQTHALARFNLDTRATDLVDDRASGGDVSPDGRFIVCTCPRQGYAPGTWIVYPLERPNEFAVLRIVGGDQREVRFKWAPTTARLPFLARVSVSFGLGPPLIGTTHQLRASGVDTAGRIVEPGVVRWRSQDTSVATVDSSGVLRPRRAGRVTINASAGGWRDTQTILTIGEPTMRVVLDENWTRGLEAEWNSFGDPKPQLVQDSVLVHAFLNNGDGSFFSGAYTSRAFDTRGGLWVEADVSTPIKATDSQEQLFSFFAMADSAAWTRWDHVTGDGPPGVSSPNWGFRYPQGTGGKHYGEQFLLSGPSGNYLLPAPAVLRTGQRFRLVLQIFPDGRCGLAIDGKVLWVGPADFFETSVHLMLAGNSVATKTLVGHLRISTGIAPKIIWY